MIAECDSWNPPVGWEDAWRSFIWSVMIRTVRECRWIALRSKRGLPPSRVRTPTERLYSASVAWMWVFGDQESQLRFSDVCEAIGVSDEFLREKIASECRPGSDINTVVTSIIAAGDALYCGNGRPAQCQEVRVDWPAISPARAIDRIERELRRDRRFGKTTNSRGVGAGAFHSFRGFGGQNPKREIVRSRQTHAICRRKN